MSKLSNKKIDYSKAPYTPEQIIGYGVELIPAVAKKSLDTSIPTKRLGILAPPSEIKQDIPPNQTSTVTRVL